MYFEKHFSTYGKFCKKPSILVLASALFLSACGSSDDDTGNIRFYNLSENAPELFLTIDENLDVDDSDDFEATFSGVDFTEIGPRTAIDTDNYFYEIAFADDDDDNDRDDFEIVAEGSFSVREDAMQLIVVDSDVAAPEVTIYNVEEFDNDRIDDDNDNDLFNVRLLNAHSTEVPTLFLSTEEDLSDPVEVGSVSFRELSDNIQLEQERYFFFLENSAGEVVFISNDDLEFRTGAQFIFVIRRNIIDNNSPFVLDVISAAGIIELEGEEAEASFRVYNAIGDSDILDAELDAPFSGNIEFTLLDIDDSPTSGVLAQRELSERTILTNGNFVLNVIDADTDSVIINNSLVTLDGNDDITAFVYVTEVSRDRDGDGIIDENNDGVVDVINTVKDVLLVDNSTSQSILSHEFQLLNFIDPQEFTEDRFDSVDFRFVTSNDDAENPTLNMVVPYGESRTIVLSNTTYELLVVAIVDSTEQVLRREVITLTEDTVAQFLVLEGDAETGDYNIEMFDQ